ncbi:MAG: glycosyltransferase family 39 protein [Lachnospiraceae bacterium]|nr:glycosyltransferase family 39 protein [Lachnospiraceae bacterium]
MSSKLGKIIGIIMIIAFAVIMLYMLFHNLGEGYLIQTDEAYHATNAYEMYKQGNWIVNTYRYASDYFNSKPPLCLDLMVLSYKALGVSGFAARFPSAVGAVITFILIAAFLIYRKDLYSAALFAALFCACSDLFLFHMYRAAEMDSIFNLFFTTAMLSLMLMREKPYFMYVYGLALGLAFMCKGPHAAIILMIGLLYIPMTKNAFSSVRRVIISAVLAVVIPAAWMIKRYMFDGTELLRALFVGEVTQKVASENQLENMAITSFITSPIAIIFGVMAVITIIVTLIGRKAGKVDPGMLKELFKDNYLYLLWAIVPIIFFSFPKTFLPWYIYSSQIAMCVLTAGLLSWCIRIPGGESVLCTIAVYACTIALSLCFMIPTITKHINVAGMGGNPVDGFTDAMLEFQKQYGDEYSGVNTYLVPAITAESSEENSDSSGENDEGHWTPEYVAPAEMYCDLLPVDGTVDNFINDPDAILILDKSRWDEYSYVLAGHVILQDMSYLIFSSDYY